VAENVRNPRLQPESGLGFLGSFAQATYETPTRHQRGTSEAPSWDPQATPKPLSCDPQATLMRVDSHLIASPKHP